jgi:hypothetical protein
MVKIRHKIGVIEIAIALAIVAIPIGVAVRYWQAARFVKDDSNRVRGAAWLLLIYADGVDHMPATCIHGPTGEVLSSWRFAATQKEIYQVELEQEAGYPAIDKAWNAKENAVLRDSSRWRSYIDPTRPGRKARFVAITGPGTAFDEAAPCRLPGQSNQSLPVVPASTILFVEVANSPKHWMEPGDLDIRTMDHSIGGGTGNGPSGVYPEGFWVGFADCQCWYLTHDTPFDELAKFFTLDGANRNDRRKVLGKFVIREVPGPEWNSWRYQGKAK